MILVTGATGFVGRHLVERLIAENRRVRIWARKEGSLTGAWRTKAGVEVFCAPDLTDELGDELMYGVGSVLHLAGLAHRPKSGSTTFHNANTNLTSHLAEAARKAEVAKFVHLSSLAAITTNAASVVIDDKAPSIPDTPYGKSKRNAEKEIEEKLATKALAISLRPPLITGWDARGNWAALQKLAATGLPLPFGSVRSARNYLSVETLLDMLAHIVDLPSGAGKSGSYVVCDPEIMTLPDTIRLLREGMDLPERLFGFPPDLLLKLGGAIGRKRQFAGLLGELRIDGTRFCREFGFTYKGTLQQSIRRSGTDYKKKMRTS